MREMWTNWQWRLRAVVLLLVDILCILLTDFLALWMRFEFRISDDLMGCFERLYRYVPIQVVLTILIFGFLHMYSSLWKYASINEFLNVIVAVAGSSVLNAVIMYLAKVGVPRSFPFIYMLLLGIFAFGTRFSYRCLRHVYNRYGAYHAGEKPANVMVIGAGDAGAAIIKEMCLSISTQEET